MDLVYPRDYQDVAGYEYLAVSPEGDLYPCHQFVGKEDYKIGHISTGIVKPEIPKEFKASHVLKKMNVEPVGLVFIVVGDAMPIT